jgi:DNA-binding response OmpR family regulator
MGSQCILLVDDQPLVLTAIARVLEERGYQVRTASNGEEALQSADSVRPDLVITDIRMSVMDGWTLVRRLRARADFALMPVIILTDHNTAESRMQGYRLGADDFVPKTTKVEELEVRIERALRRSEDIQRAIHLAAPRKRGSAQRGVPPAEEAPPRGQPAATPAEHTAFGLDLPPLAVAMAQRNPATADLDEDLAAQEPTPGITGTLDQIGLSSILTLLSSGEKTGVLTLSREDQEDHGEILLRAGQVLRIRLYRLPDLKHADGIAEMMRWKNARFAFFMMNVSGANEVGTPTEHLLMEASRQMDEGGA